MASPFGAPDFSMRLATCIHCRLAVLDFALEVKFFAELERQGMAKSPYPKVRRRHEAIEEGERKLGRRPLHPLAVKTFQPGFGSPGLGGGFGFGVGFGFGFGFGSVGMSVPPCGNVHQCATGEIVPVK
jgi:hypothetical protein